LFRKSRSFAALFLFAWEKNAATARSRQIRLLVMASYAMVFALKTFCKRKHFAKK
jgi:hypothetical protein